MLRTVVVVNRRWPSSATRVWTRRWLGSSVRSSSSDALYRQPELGNDPARNFPIWAQRTWEQCEQKLKLAGAKPLAGKEEAQSSTIVRTIDGVSEELCAVLDTASCCASTHGNLEARQAAERTFLELYEKVQTINTNQGLYDALKIEHETRQQSKAGDDDDDEVDRVSSKLLKEFEWEGANLETIEEKHAIGDLQNHIRTLEAKLQHDAMTLDSRRKPMKISGLDIPNTEGNFRQLLSHSSLASSEKREVFLQRFRLDSALESFAHSRQELRLSRHELAVALGFKSWGHLAVHKNMADNTYQVDEFLVRIAEQLKPLVNRIVGEKGTLLNEDEIHNHPRFANKAQRVSKRVDSFFTVDKCLFGLQQIAEKVFDVKLTLQPNLSAPWDATTACWEMHLEGNGAGEPQGVLYLDLFARPEKAPGAALYQMRTRRRLHGCSVAMLSCSFPCTAPSEPGRTVVGHAGFRTLMHEFGHALHALLSETRYQHLSGTRCEMDFMETPSLILERMSWDARVLRLLDERKATFDDDDLQAVERTRLGGYSALDLQEQVLCALFDMAVCGPDVTKSENQLYWSVRERYGSFSVPANKREVRKELYFNHLLGTYAGSFYSYPWSSAIALDVWQALFEKDDPTRSSAGGVLKRELLARGGSRDPFDVLERLTGKRVVDETALIRDLCR